MTILDAKPTIPSENILSAGGEDPHRFEVKEAWYPVFYLDDLSKSQPNTFTLLEIDIVIWWESKTQSWKAFRDACPHRLAPLSEGRINEEGWLECPYHGWAFSGSGNCEVIPQQEEGGNAHTSKRACVQAFPTAIAQGLLFVYPGQPENAPRVTVPIIEALEEDAPDWVCLNTFRDLPYDALTLLENVIDASHIPYTHHATVGNRSNVSSVKLEVTESGKQGFTGIWEEGPRKGTLGKQNTFFVAPNLMWHDLTSKQFGRTLTVVYATPIRKGECRLFARFPFKFASKLPGLVMKLTPRWYTHIGQNGVLEDDQIFLHLQERYLEAKGGSNNFAKAFYLPTSADAYVSELRKWVNEYEVNPFAKESFSPALSREALLNRYESHTRKCASCLGASRNIQRLRLGIAIASVGLWAILPLMLVTLEPSVWVVSALTVLSLTGGAVWLGLGRLEKQFFTGRDIPPRNLPNK